jgi:hypothetical protein
MLHLGHLIVSALPTPESRVFPNLLLSLSSREELPLAIGLQRWHTAQRMLSETVITCFALIIGCPTPSSSS